jgi:rRNA-processing protein FCF1
MIETFCVQQALKTPVIVIANDEKLILTKKLKNIGVPVEPLFQSSFLQSNGLLSVFTKK